MVSQTESSIWSLMTIFMEHLPSVLDACFQLIDRRSYISVRVFARRLTSSWPGNLFQFARLLAPHQRLTAKPVMEFQPRAARGASHRGQSLAEKFAKDRHFPNEAAWVLAVPW
jgi:hypothetical protein